MDTSAYTMSLLSLTKIVFIFTVYLIFLFALLLPLAFYILRWKCQSKKRNHTSDKPIIAFFHPYCNAGGGGEKVLWVAIQALQKRYNKIEIYIYTGDIGVSPEEIIGRVRRNLNIQLEDEVKFIYLTKRRFIEAKMYPYFTLLGQSLGSVYLGYEALKSLNPDIFIDTTGYSFTLPIFKYIAGSKTACYVHYPTITVEMLKRVSTRQIMYNNRSTIARSPFLTSGKLIYYRLFAWLYSLAGDCSDVSMVNSTFTLEHLTSLWNNPLRLVYPPCEVNHLKTIQRKGKFPTNIRILSLAQFRPEKDHQLQIQALYELRELISEELFERVTLVLCGSCRNEEDSTRVKDLKDFSKHLSVENNVEFRVNVTYEELLEEFKNASLGMHTMIDEHFGIGVVELLAAGLVTIAHKSGGPLLDIIETTESSRLGYLATSAKEYALTIQHILSTDENSILRLIERARASVDRFTNKKFQDEFLKAVDHLLD